MCFDAYHIASTTTNCIRSISHIACQDGVSCEKFATFLTKFMYFRTEFMRAVRIHAFNPIIESRKRIL